MGNDRELSTMPDDSLERRLATCLELNDASVERILALQAEGNTAKFEEIAVSLGLASRTQVRRCLRKFRTFGVPGLFRAHPNLAVVTSHVVIAIFAGASFFLSLVDHFHARRLRAQSPVATLAVQAVRSQDYRTGLKDGLWQRSIMVGSGAPMQDAPDNKVVLVVANIGDEDAPEGCILGNMRYSSDQTATKKLGDYVNPGGSGVSIGRGHGLPYLTDVEYSDSIEWEQLSFDVGCSGKPDVNSVAVKEREWYKPTDNQSN